jgi:hypothetical protein
VFEVVDGWVECPQCGTSTCVDQFHHVSGTDSTECDDCGCKFQYRFEVYMDIIDVMVLQKGSNWDEDEDED